MPEAAHETRGDSPRTVFLDHCVRRRRCLHAFCAGSEPSQPAALRNSADVDPDAGRAGGFAGAIVIPDAHRDTDGDTSVGSNPDAVAKRGSIGDAHGFPVGLTGLKCNRRRPYGPDVHGERGELRADIHCCGEWI